MAFAEIFSCDATANLVCLFLASLDLVRKDVLVQGTRVCDDTRNVGPDVILVYDSCCDLAIPVKAGKHRNHHMGRPGFVGQGYLHPESYVDEGVGYLLLFDVVLDLQFLPSG